MNLTSLLDSITQRQAERRVDKWTEYRNLVASVCDGNEPNADRIASVLADNDRTLEQLRHDVQLLVKRRKLSAEMDAAPPLENERQEVEQLIIDGEKELEAITEAHRQKMSPLYSRRFEINQVCKLAQQSKDELRSTCEDPEVVARYETVNEELSNLLSERSKLEREINQRRIWKEDDMHKSTRTPFRHEVNRYIERTQDHAARMEQMLTKLPALNARIDELNKQMNEIELELLEP